MDSPSTNDVRYNKKSKKIIIIAIVLALCLGVAGVTIGINMFSESNVNSSVVKYDNGDYIFIPQEKNIAFDEDSKLLYYNNLIKVFLWDNIDKETEDDIAETVGGEIVGRTYGVSNFLQIKIPETNLSNLSDKISRLKKNENVLFADYDMPSLVITDEVDENLWDNEGNSKNNTIPDGNDWWAEAIGAYKAWEYEDYIEEPVIVGIADNGVDENHEDFIKDDKTSKVTVLDKTTATPNDHGTHVAGIIGAINNTTGIRGIANNSDLLSFDAMRSSELMESQKLLYENGAKVINNSWGNRIMSQDEFNYAEIIGETNKNGEEYDAVQIYILEKFLEYYSGAYDQYINYNKTLCQKTALECICQMVQFELSGDHDYIVVKSAGNGYVDSEGNGTEHGHDAFYSGYYAGINEETYNLINKSVRDKLQENGISFDRLKEHIMVVGATQKANEKDDYALTYFSNYGNIVDIVAPGDSILSCATVLDDSDSKNSSAKAGVIYDYLSGTSMSAPMISGAAALLWSIDPSLSSAEIKKLLIDTSGTATGVTDEDIGRKYPMLNVGNAVEELLKINNKLKYAYTAEELSTKSVSEIVDIMGGDFKHDKNKGIIYYTSGGYYIYNDDILPGFVFYLNGENVTADSFAKKSTDEIKSDIENGLYQIDFIAMYDSAKLNDSISADMNYKDFITAYGDMDTTIIPGTGYPGHYINNYNNGNIGTVVVYYQQFDDSIYSSGTEVISKDLMINKNPNIYAIVALPKTDSENESSNNKKKLTEEEVRAIAQKYWDLDSLSSNSDGTKYGVFVDVDASEMINNTECYRVDLKWEPKGSTVYSSIDWMYVDVFTGDTYDANGNSSLQTKTSETNSDEKWKEVYIDYLNNNGLDEYGSYGLIYLNDDDVPEVVMFGSFDMVPTKLLWIDESKAIHEETIGGRTIEVTYMEKQGKILHSDFLLGEKSKNHISVSVYSLNDNDFSSAFSCSYIGEYNFEEVQNLHKNNEDTHVYSFSVGSTSVSEDDFFDSLLSFYDIYSSECKSIQSDVRSNSKSDLISRIQNY